MNSFHSIALAAILAVPSTAFAQESQGYAPGAEPKGDIIEVATEAGSFTTLAKAIEAAGLVETLKGEGPFTVFAPTDEAFAKLPAGTLDSLLKDREKLTAILTYHVVAGKVSSEDVAQLPMAKTVNGKDLKITCGRREGDGRERDRYPGRHPDDQRRDPRDRHRPAAGVVRPIVARPSCLSEARDPMRGMRSFALLGAISAADVRPTRPRPFQRGFSHEAQAPFSAVRRERADRRM